MQTVLFKKLLCLKGFRYFYMGVKKPVQEHSHNVTSKE
jgi:hypothetical protein